MRNAKMFLQTAVVYVRVFNRESRNVYTTDEQEEAIVGYAAKNGFRILKVFREGNASAKSFDRPRFKEMLEYIESNKWKVKFLIVSDIQRLSTDPVGLPKLRHFLKRSGVKLISIVQSMLRHKEKQVKRYR